MCKSKKTSLNIVLFIVFIFFSIIIFIALKQEKDQKVTQFLNNKTTIYTQNYQVIYNHYKRLSKVIFDTKINTKATIDILKNLNEQNIDSSRTKLYKNLEQTYSVLKKENLKQLHFHLKNNDSFLRFHRPKKYGDNLTKVRETVNYVNTQFKAVDGFEEGRIYNGYRFVYPLDYKNEHLGSVEISFSTFAMLKDIIKNYHTMANFLIVKTKVDEKLFEDEKSNYMDSQINGFYMEKRAFEHIKKIAQTKQMEKPSQKTITKVNEFFKDNNEQTLSLFCQNQDRVMTFIKIKNPITNEAIGLFVIKSDGQYIYNKNKNFYFLLNLAILFLIVVLIFIKEEISYRNKIKQDHKEIERLNGNLQEEIDEAIENLRIKETLLAQKSKMAAMGEMIDSIAHQWMQPISIVKLKLQMLELDLTDKNEKIDTSKAINSIHSCDEQIKHLTQTINEFRAFFRPNEQKQTMPVKTLIDSALVLIKDEIIKNNIQIKTTGNTDINLKVTGNEFKHVIINLVNNAKDAFIQNNIKDKIIKFNVEVNGYIIISITDNAGGIPKNIIDNIFEANFTTKKDNNGTGIGLYMTKQIIEKMDAKISVSNVENGASFKIEIPKNYLI